MYSYEYDKLGQLVRYNDKVANKSYTYTYDNNGNILTKSEYAYTTGVLGVATDTTTYTYDSQWKDKLTGVRDKTIAYDNIGNPTTYLGADLVWQGRQLTSYSNAENTFNYEYDENGMRYRTTITSKEDNSVGYLDYVWVDSKLISISFTSDELNQTVKYLYNDFDEPVGFVSTREDGSVDTFYYLKNAQGDITHIVSAAGKKMVTFTYDVFGKRTVTYQANGSTTPGQIELLTQMKADLLNPFAYRGYCYDYDMGMYYLQSRYYDPNISRFINSDDTNYLDATGTVLGCNLFAYCENDPVNKVDAGGCASNSASGYSYGYNYSAYYRALNKKSHYRIFCSIDKTSVFGDYDNGVIKVWNAQSNIGNIFKGKTTTFAYVLFIMARRINKKSLSQRTVDGVAYELIAHYVWYKKNIVKSKSKESDCGGIASGKVGYDYNAYIFEKDKSKLKSVENAVKQGDFNSALKKLAPTLAKLGWQKISSK